VSRYGGAFKRDLEYGLVTVSPRNWATTRREFETRAVDHRHTREWMGPGTWGQTVISRQLASNPGHTMHAAFPDSIWLNGTCRLVRSEWASDRRDIGVWFAGFPKGSQNLYSEGWGGCDWGLGIMWGLFYGQGCVNGWALWRGWGKEDAVDRWLGCGKSICFW
jgi:hypothetical protein